jgi:hypothetical protein
MLATDKGPGTRRRTWDALDLVVDDGSRDPFYSRLVNGLDLERFRVLLTDTDPAVRHRVRWSDTRGGGRSGIVHAALEALADERFGRAWPDCVEVLRRPVDFRLLVGTLVDAPDEGVRERLLVTLGLPRHDPHAGGARRRALSRPPAG